MLRDGALCRRSGIRIPGSQGVSLSDRHDTDEQEGTREGAGLQHPFFRDGTRRLLLLGLLAPGSQAGSLSLPLLDVDFAGRRINLIREGIHGILLGR